MTSSGNRRQAAGAGGGDLVEPERKLKVEVDLRIVVVESEDLVDALDAVLERRDMDHQLARRLAQPPALEKHGQGVGEIGVAAGVVVDQHADPAPDELVQLAGVVGLEEQGIDAEMVE